MRLVNLSRIFFDGNHNAFTDVCRFRGDYYVTFRHSTRHIHPDGRALILRGLDGGARWMVAGTVYAGLDTRDPKFMVADDRLFVYAFSFQYGEEKKRIKASGYSVTTDGDHWSPWQKIEDDWVYWHPRLHEGRAYVIAYREADGKVMLKTSEDGVAWEDVCLVCEDGKPNETSLLFAPDGEAVALIRRGHESGHPFLSRSAPPYTEWRHTEVQEKLNNPLLWWVGEELWACCRWYPASGQACTAIFRFEGEAPVLQLVLPSGGDTSYAGIVQKPDDPGHYLLTYYSSHECLTEWRAEGAMPAGIYLAELELP